MKISQLFERKSNPSQQPRRCCHQHPDGTECSAHPQRGTQYCFFHDPALQEQRRQASSAGGRASTGPPLLPPDLPILSLKTASDVASLLEETVNQVRHGQMDLRAATTICYIANSLVHALEVNARAERAAAKAAAAPVPSKKHPAPLQIILRDHTGRIIDQLPPDPGFVPQSKQKKDLSPRMDTDQHGLPFLRTEDLSRRAVDREPRTVSLGTASSNTPSPSVEQGMGKAQPVTPPLRTENGELRTAVQYPPGMGPRHLGPGPGGSLMAGTPSMPWWRRERLNKAT